MTGGFASEQDRINCSFYFKIGACRHGDQCSRKHVRPGRSRTILLSNVFQNPRHLNPHSGISEAEVQRQFDDLYEDLFVELSKYGDLVEMHICDNIGEHLIGNVYARHETEDDAQRATDILNTRWYGGRPLFVELSPVTDFREARCRQNESNECNRGGLCNFMHLRLPTPGLMRDLDHQLTVENRERRRERRAIEDIRRLGWKDRLVAEDPSSGLTKEEVLDRAMGWRRGATGGDWRADPAVGQSAETEPPAANAA